MMVNDNVNVSQSQKSSPPWTGLGAKTSIHDQDDIYTGNDRTSGGPVKPQPATIYSNTEETTQPIYCSSIQSAPAEDKPKMQHAKAHPDDGPS